MRPLKMPSGEQPSQDEVPRRVARRLRDGYLLAARTSAVAVLVTSIAALCACSSSSSNDCIPPSDSCDLGSPSMYRIDFTNGCLAAQETLTAVCGTSVNRCAPSAGLGPVCAFAPDGGAFIVVMSDNDRLTAPGWHFTEGDEVPGVPADEEATAAEGEQCSRATCMMACPSVPPPSYSLCLDHDAGEGGSG
jgi:hypothetical protein